MFENFFDFYDDYNITYEEIKKKVQGTVDHTVGIVAIEDWQKNDFEFWWPAYSLPLSDNLTLLERSVIECIWAGCESVWVVARDSSMPFVEELLPEYILDPYDAYNLHQHGKQINKATKIPIFRLRVNLKSHKRREYQSWHILGAAKKISRLHGDRSKWFRPDRFYVSFPQGVYNPNIAKIIRYQVHKELKREENIFLNHNNNSVQNNKYLGFTFNMADFKECREKIWDMGTPRNWSELYRNSEKMNIGNIFSEAKKHKTQEIDKYFPITDWKEYIHMCKNQPGGLVGMPERIYKRERKWDPISSWVEES